MIFSRISSSVALPPCTDAPHGRAPLFHFHRRSLYDAIGEPDGRFRRPTPIAPAIERMMILDAVLSSRDITWLSAADEKVAHFTRLLHERLDRDELPHLTLGRGKAKATRYFPDKFPIGVRPETGTHVFTYLITRAVPVDFRQFLHRHAGLCEHFRAGRFGWSCRAI